ncbi:RecT family recombinational DNA repair protein [Lacticaseibacillus casei 12A]|uniref:RecT family recombinase n=1 Tax=Lacticaseibacillus paracasei TaxID=1597 RepID=UPI0002981107|nr:RecT family recombinase [Lacticaseibacillus paracasei]EKP98161.1 RecT family recombinational DNA repair protein [Lacticaseibacillus casei 12A]
MLNSNKNTTNESDSALQSPLVVATLQSIQEYQTERGLVLPPNYSAGNALTSAYLMLSDSSNGLSVVQKMEKGEITKTSVFQALQDMVVQGLSPAKNQGYFIQYGKQLQWTRSYFGAVAIVKRQRDVEGTPTAEVIYEDDVFETGVDDQFRTIVTKFKHSFQNQDKPIIGAFARITFKDGHSEYTIMTKKEIDQSWSHTKMKSSGGPQKEFPQEMAKRTVLNRAAKMIINTSDDNDLVIESVNRGNAAENDYNDPKPKDVTPDFKQLMSNNTDSHEETDEVNKDAEISSKDRDEQTQDSESNEQRNSEKEETGVTDQEVDDLFKQAANQ